MPLISVAGNDVTVSGGFWARTRGSSSEIKLHGRTAYPATPSSAFAVHLTDDTTLAVSNVSRSGDTITIDHADSGNDDVYVVPSAALQTSLGLPPRIYLPWNGTATPSTANHNAAVAAYEGGTNSSTYFRGENTIRDLQSGIWLMFACTWELLAARAPGRFSEPVDRACIFESGTRLYLDGLFADDGWAVKMSCPNSAACNALHTGPSLVWVSGRDRLGERTGGIRLTVIVPDGRFPDRTSGAFVFRSIRDPFSFNGSSELHWFGAEMHFVDENDRNATQNLYGISMTNANSDVSLTIRSLPRKPGDTTFLVMRVRFGAMTRGSGRLDISLVDTFPILDDIAVNTFNVTSISQIEGANRGGSGNGAGMNVLSETAASTRTYHTVENYAPKIPTGGSIDLGGGLTRVPVSLRNPTLDPTRITASGPVRIEADITVRAVDTLGRPVAGVPFTITNSVDPLVAADSPREDSAPAWVSGRSYAAGNTVARTWNDNFARYNKYEAINATSGTLNPEADTTNWRGVTGTPFRAWDSVSHIAQGTIVAHGGTHWEALRNNNNVEPTDANTADWRRAARPDTSPAATTGADGRAVIRRTIYSLAQGRALSGNVPQWVTDGRAATLRMRHATYETIERSVSLAAGTNEITVQVNRDAAAPATLPDTSQGRVAFDVARKVVSPPDYSMSPRTLYGLLKRDLPATLAPFFTMSGNTLTLEADWDVTFSTPTSLGLQAGPDGDDSDRLVLQGTGTFTGLVGAGIRVSDSTGSTVRLITTPGARVIHSVATHELRYYVPDIVGGRLKCFSRASRTAAPVAGTDIDLQGVTRDEIIQGISRMRGHRSFLAGIWNFTTNSSRIAIFDDSGRQVASSDFIPAGADSAYVEIGSIAYASDTLAYASMTRRLDYTASRVFSFDPSALLSGSTIAPSPRRAAGSGDYSLVWIGSRLAIIYVLFNLLRMRVMAPQTSGALVQQGEYQIHNTPFSNISTPTGVAIHHEVDSPDRAVLSIVGGQNPLLGIDLEIDPVVPQTVHARRRFTLPGINSTVAFTAFDAPTLGTEVLATAGADGVAGIRVPAAQRTAIRHVTAKMEGFDYRTGTLNPLVDDTALVLTKNTDIDLSVDISDYDLTSSGGATKNVYASPTNEGTGSTIYFSDTYDLKAETDKSKRVLDAVLSTDEGLKLLHRYGQAPSLNNDGRVVSFHPTFVNILPGWIAFIRKPSLPLGARAAFGIATYVGDDSTFYRPRELNGGHVEISDPAVYVRFDTPRIRTVSREIIEDAGNQQAIADAVLDSTPSMDDAENSVSRILYALRNGASLTETQATAIERLTQARADKIDALSFPAGTGERDLKVTLDGEGVRLAATERVPAVAQAPSRLMLIDRAPPWATFRSPSTLVPEATPAALPPAPSNSNIASAAHVYGNTLYVAYTQIPKLRAWNVTTWAAVELPTALMVWANALGTRFQGLVVTEHWVIARDDAFLRWWNRDTEAEDTGRRHAIGSSLRGGASVNGGYVYVATGQNNGILQAYNLSDGNRSSARDIALGGNIVPDAVVVTDDAIYIASDTPGQSHRVQRRLRSAPATSTHSVSVPPSVDALALLPAIEAVTEVPAMLEDAPLVTAAVNESDAVLDREGFRDRLSWSLGQAAVQAAAVSLLRAGGVVAEVRKVVYEAPLTYAAAATSHVGRLLSRIRLVANPADASQYRVASAAEDVSKDTGGKVKIDEVDLTTKLSTNAPLQNALGGINWNRGLGLVDDVTGSVGSAVARVLGALTNTRIEALDDVDNIKDKTDKLKFEAGDGEQPVESYLKTGHLNVPTGLTVPSANDIADTVNSRAAPAMVAETSLSKRVADVKAKTDKLKFEAGDGEQPVESYLKTGHLNVPTGLTVPSANDIAAAVLRRVPDADTDPANPTGSLQRLLQTSVGQATLARQALVNNVVRDEDASTLALRNDANDGDLITWDLRNADGDAAGTGTAYERRRRA